MSKPINLSYLIENWQDGTTKEIAHRVNVYRLKNGHAPSLDSTVHECCTRLMKNRGAPIKKYTLKVDDPLCTNGRRARDSLWHEKRPGAMKRWLMGFADIDSASPLNYLKPTALSSALWSKKHAYTETAAR